MGNWWPPARGRERRHHDSDGRAKHHHTITVGLDAVDETLGPTSLKNQLTGLLTAVTYMKGRGSAPARSLHPPNPAREQANIHFDTSAGPLIFLNTLVILVEMVFG